MHYRFRVNSIQVVKSQPDPETGKAKSVPMGSINRATMAISNKLRESCSPAELQQVVDWVQRHQSIEKLKNRHAVLTLPEQMAAATQWFEDGDFDVNEARQAADDIMATMAFLRRALVRHDFIV